MICHIKTILAVLDISQQGIADAVGVNRNTITSLSRNKSLPNLQLAYDVVDFFNTQAEAKGISSRWAVEDVWERNGTT